MSEHEQIDRVLSEAMSGPVPALSPEFDRRLAAGVRGRRVGPRGRLVLGSYAALALVVSLWTMRQASVEWSMIAAATLIPLVVVTVACRRWVWPHRASA